MNREWSIERARHTYSIPHWSEGYVDVGANGKLLVLPRGPGGPEVALAEVVAQARHRGLELPVLVRFVDILGDKLRRLQRAFATAMSDR